MRLLGGAELARSALHEPTALALRRAAPQMIRLSKALPRPELRALAESTRGKLEDFKAYVPLITAACNPGAPFLLLT